MYKGLFNKKGIEVDDIRGGLNVKLDDRWKWLSMVDRLSGGDITKLDLVYERNYIECLNLLSFWYERDRYIEEINKKRK